MKPLAGCRVLDLGIITAGAATTAMLADFGAEVIKVESPAYRDPFRRWLPALPSTGGTAQPPFFRATNRNKLGLSLDLKKAAGRDVFLRLVRNSDIVVENFRRGVMQNLGLDYATLKAANPDIILASVSSQGESGPDAACVSYGSTLEAVGGLAWMTGYAGGPPTVSGVDFNFPDQVAALFAASLIVTALRSCRAGGGGAHLDISQRELTSYMLGEAFIAAGAGLPVARSGNGQEPYVLQDSFRSADGRWLAVSVERSQLDGLSAAVGADLRGQGEAQLAASVGAWVAAWPLAFTLERLQSQAIAAAESLNGEQACAQRGSLWQQGLESMPDGLVKGFAMQFGPEPMTIGREAPPVGAHTAQVLRDVAGLSAGEIDALHAAGVIELSATNNRQQGPAHV